MHMNVLLHHKYMHGNFSLNMIFSVLENHLPAKIFTEFIKISSDEKQEEEEDGKEKWENFL